MYKGSGFTNKTRAATLYQFASALAISCLWTVGAFGETLLTSADTHTRSNAPTSNFGGDSTIRVRSGSHAGYIFFDLASLTSTEFSEAALRVYIQSATAMANIAVHEVIGPWQEASLTHQTAPPLNLIPTAESTVSPGDAGSYLAFDVTALVAGWIASPSSNFGLSLQALTSDARVTFSSREAGLPAELEVLEFAGKPNVVRVQLEGGDYTNPVDAMNDSDSWCDESGLSAADSCQLLIGPGTFTLAEPLNLRDQFGVVGAGKSGSQLTELIAEPGVEAVIQLVGALFKGTQGHNLISDLRVRNDGGANGNVRGIWSISDDDDDSNAIIRNVSVDVSGGVSDAVTGISVTGPVLRNVDVSVVGGSNAVGISSVCAEGADVQVSIRAFGAQSSIGWREQSDCGTPIFRFDVSVIGPNSVGLRFDTMNAAQLAEGTVVAGGIGILIAGETHLRNLGITASTAIQCLFCDPALLDNVHVLDSETALNMSQAFFVQVTDSTFAGETLVPSDPSNSPAGILRIDNSSIGPITIEPGPSVFIGSSKVTGPIVSGAGQVTCINVYDGNYQPITCD